MFAVFNFGQTNPAAEPPLPLPAPLAAPVRPSQIIEPERLAAELAPLALKAEADRRTAVLACLRAALDRGRAVIQSRFLASNDGDACVMAQAYLIDQVILTLAAFQDRHLYPSPNPTSGEQYAIVAVGGYGRGEMAPFSDIDLLFLLPYKQTPRVEQLVESMLYTLWDLGLKVGHAVRTVSDSLRQAKADITIRTGLLERRFLWGDCDLYGQLDTRFAKEVATGTGSDFIAAKLAERDERHRKMGESRYVLEPNVKEGKGGFRDLQTLLWIGQYLYPVRVPQDMVANGLLTDREGAQFVKAMTFLRTLRCHLHYIAGRAEERVTFDVQTEIGARMGYTDRAGTKAVERFMKHYFLVAKDVGALTRGVCAQLEAQAQKTPLSALFGFGGKKDIDGFPVTDGRLDVADPELFRADPVALLRIFRAAQLAKMDLHPAALRLIGQSIGLITPSVRQDPAGHTLFRDLIATPQRLERTLRQMNEAGVLGRYIPDFGRVVCQMQYDMYHVYTTDEHTLFAMGILARIELGEAKDSLALASREFDKVRGRRALYFAMLCHDIAKGRNGDHSILGAKVVDRLGPRLGFSAEEVETASWLVRWHLLMSDTAFKRDIDDFQTVAQFAHQVASMERLRMLMILTTADISAVGPGRWTSWRASLIARLFHGAADLLQGGFAAKNYDQRVETAKRAARTALTDFTEAEVEAFLSKGYPSYWVACDLETQLHHARLLRQAARDGSPLVVDTRIDARAGITEITVITGDHPGLFSRLAGAMAAAGANILEAKIFTQTDGTALDVFTVEDAARGGAFDQPDKLARLSVIIDRTLDGDLRKLHEVVERPPNLPPRASVFTVQPRVLIDNATSTTHTLIEINGRDRPGLLYELTRTLTGLSLQIATAKISTYGERAVDTFYVKDVFGLKVTNAGRLDRIRARLLDTLGGPADDAGTPST